MFKAKVLVSLPSPKALALCLSNPGWKSRFPLGKDVN